MGFNIKGPWQPGHQRESFHLPIIYTVPLVTLFVTVVCLKIEINQFFCIQVMSDKYYFYDVDASSVNFA